MLQERVCDGGQALRPTARKKETRVNWQDLSQWRGGRGANRAMRRVEQHVIEKSHPQFRAIDEMALASKNLWNLANYHVRQSFIFQQKYLTTTALFHLLKATDPSHPLPPKIANQVLLKLHQP